MMKKTLQNEEGIIALFVLGMLGIIMILLILVVNLGGALAVKESSATTVQQASLAGSSVLYEEVRQIIYDYEDETLEGALQAFFEDIEEKVGVRADALTSNSSYNGWTANEIHIEAFDQVLKDELNRSVVREKLEDLLQYENIESKVIDEVKETILENDGVLEGAKLYIRDHRIYVKAANDMEAFSYDGYMEGIKENIYQESAGPKIDFINVIWDGRRTVPLD
ncbi:hypothetical protein SAMN05216232_1438 [Virgibacillus subterraneus]|uniref:Flp pilus-assembly TadG-like N-terminal domain-containing protein n=1 Tax=Virgibacillus subterraneus TaxID=621109 RepID=A0A1H9C3C6_9BACI|nr:hypothetical protein [Virgibacillus subterraneus]SEP95477.1 hypothetical protein SAMN05216232_1438 [Virgibacillus subterraneus]